MRVFIGWLSLVLAVLSLAPSFVPGAVSVIGLGCSFFALFLSLFSVSPGKNGFFYLTLVFVLIGILLINDLLRLFGSLPNVSMRFKAIVYAVSVVVIYGCLLISRKLSDRS